MMASASAEALAARTTRGLMCVVALDVTLYSLALPYFPGVLQEGVSERTWLHGQAASNGLAALAGFVVGALSDWLGRKRLLVASQIVCVACWGLFVAGVVAVRADLLLAAFVLRKSNRTFPLACSLVTDVTPVHELRQQRLSRLGSMFGLGFALGPAAAGVASRWFDVASLFAFGLALAVFNLVVVGSSIPGNKPARVAAPSLQCEREREDAARTDAAPPDTGIFWAQIQRAIREPNLGLVLMVHALACMGQFSYITTMAVAAKDRFGMDSAAYGTLLTFLGISYSFCLAFVIPPLAHLLGDLRHLLVAALGVTSLARFYIARLHGPEHVSRLFLGHAVVAVGTSGINFVIADLVTSWGRRLNLTGIVVGTQDSVQRVMGVVAPLLVASLAAALPAYSERAAKRAAAPSLANDTGPLFAWVAFETFFLPAPGAPAVFLGAQVSAVLYLCALAIALLLYIVPTDEIAQARDYQEVQQEPDNKQD